MANKPGISNKYTRVLGYAALVLIAVGVFSVVIQTTQADPNSPTRTNNTVLWIGVAVGVAWLVVKAVLRERKS
ncbi:hypothetical protein [Amycolatopsis sp. NPDC006125]|uniref:hypothetical protein n=1 Tax=Amycolatopsis sp. NPDC006125 TaxID=3156730 RepID=UPI0033B1A60D